MSTLGGREEETARLEEAVTAYRSALEVRTSDAMPLDWAETQDHLSLTLANLGKAISDVGKVREAIEAATRARVFYAKNGPQQNARGMEAHIKRLEDYLDSNK